MIDIDEGKAMVAYWGNGFDMIMPFSEFKDRYGHFYRKDGVERSCRTCKHRKSCDTNKYKGCYSNGKLYWEEGKPHEN